MNIKNSSLTYNRIYRALTFIHNHRSIGFGMKRLKNKENSFVGFDTYTDTKNISLMFLMNHDQKRKIAAFFKDISINLL